SLRNVPLVGLARRLSSLHSLFIPVQRNRSNAQTGQSTLPLVHSGQRNCINAQAGQSMLRLCYLIFLNRLVISLEFNSATNLSIGRASSVSVTTSPRAAAERIDFPIPE